VNFNEEIVVVDMNTFSLPAVWGFSSIGASVFHTTQVAMNAGNQSVTLTGNFLSDFLVMGDTIVVTFFYVPAMGVTDKAGNAFNATINFATGVVAAP
jgi:hypothetical protein